MNLRKMIYPLLIVCTIATAVFYSRCNENIEQSEFARLKPLADQVGEKAAGDDGDLSTEETVKFLKDIDYEGDIPEGKDMDFFLKRHPYGWYIPYFMNPWRFVVELGDSKFYVSEKTVRDYLENE